MWESGFHPTGDHPKGGDSPTNSEFPPCGRYELQAIDWRTYCRGGNCFCVVVPFGGAQECATGFFEPANRERARVYAAASAPDDTARQPTAAPCANLARAGAHYKKTFGLKVSPQNSPVQPEHFVGYHTGGDFETFPDEANADVQIYAVCTGLVRLKKYATGYGGVLVQQCQLTGQDVTVIYGHLKLASITATVGDKLNAGDAIGVLGQGYSAETSGERKHLHLELHQGTAINILGYVQHQAELAGWFDAQKYLR